MGQHIKGTGAGRTASTSHRRDHMTVELKAARVYDSDWAKQSSSGVDIDVQTHQ